jgi:hypothetical protein
MCAARAQHVGRGEDLRSAAGIERHPQAGGVVLDRRHFRAERDLDAEALEMLAQDCFGAPLRQAALKLILAADTREIRGRDLLQTRTEQLKLPDAHARVQEWLDHAGPVEDLEHRGLQGGAARFVMRREPALHDARLDAMAKKLAGREQAGRAASDDQDGRHKPVLHWQHTFSCCRPNRGAPCSTPVSCVTINNKSVSR